jgi:endonuclease-3
MASRKANSGKKPGRAVVSAKTGGAGAAAKPRRVVASAKPAGKHATRVAAGKPVPEARGAVLTKIATKARAAPVAERGKAQGATRTKPGRAAEPAEPRAVFAKLRAYHADAHCELDHRSPFELIVATVLSAQSTDVTVNQVTPELFRRWPTPAALASADPAEVERTILRSGFFRQKTKSIMGLAARLVAEHGGEVPRTLAELVKLPGVGRKTANVVLGVAFGTPEGVVVDTHVQRLSQRLGWTRHQDPLEIEQDLMRAFPRGDWDAIGHVLIFHGRRICAARKPACASCPVSTNCPSAFRAENVGRKPTRVRGD